MHFFALFGIISFCLGICISLFVINRERRILTGCCIFVRFYLSAFCTAESYLSQKSLNELKNDSDDEESEDEPEKNCTVPLWL